MSNILQRIFDILGLIVLVALAIWGMWRWLKRSDEPASLIVKWIVTGGMLFLLVWKLVAIAGSAPFIGVPLVAAWGLIFAIIWRQELTGILANPVAGLYDGGSQEDDPKPVYSVAQAHRNRGRYREAVSEIRKQLERFPTDVTGQMMIAAIYAENMQDLQGAELTVHRLIAQPDHTPRNIAYALNSLADWHLKYAQDREAAKRDLQTIIEMLPDTELSALAAQRIAHLAHPEHLLAAYDRKAIAVAPGVENLGLLLAEQQPKAPEVDETKLASEYVKHLETHPLDTEVREKLAVIYAEHFNRLDMAADQLNQLIAHPNQPAKRVVHWLNMLADLQVKHGATYETIRATLQRIIDIYPGAAAAENASSRITHLRLELKGKQKSQTVQLGSYEQDIGLKRKT